MKQRKLTAIFAAAALLASCTSFSVLDSALPKLVGQDIKVAINYLGIPDQRYAVDDEVVYVWGRTENNPFGVSTSATTDGKGNYTATTTGTGELSCKIKLMAKDGKVRKWGYDGNNGTCFTYSSRLDALAGK